MTGWFDLRRNSLPGGVTPHRPHSRYRYEVFGTNVGLCATRRLTSQGSSSTATGLVTSTTGSRLEKLSNIAAW